MQKEPGLFPTEKVMTVKEVATAIGVSTDTIKNCIRRIFPKKMQNGKTTFLNEQEIACISKELKNNCKVTEQLTYEAGSQVKNTTTDLEILENYKRANEEFVALLSRKYEEEKTKRIAAESVVNRIANSNGLKTIQETADILGYGSSTYFDLLRGKGIIFKDKKTQTNLPKREYLDSGYFEVKEEPYERNGKTFLYTRIFVTAKGLLWLEKKTPRRA